MSTTESPLPEAAPATESAATEEATERRPYIVVLMSAEMKEAVKKWADEHDTNPTALARQLLAKEVGYALEDEPATGRRSTYSSDEERKAAHAVASKKSGLLRKALFHVHNAQIHNKPGVVQAANKVVLDLSDPKLKLDMEALEALDAALTAAAKAGK